MKKLVKFQLKSEQGWIFLCKSYNYTVDNGKFKERVMFYTESYNFTVDKTI